ncbi:MAG: transcription termination factor NusA [Candidatus Binatia bacterium]
MELELKRAIDQISKEKGIDRALIIEAVEEAMISAALKTYGPELNLEASYDADTGAVEVYKIQRVVAEVEDAGTEIAIEAARAELDPDAEIGDEVMIKLDTAPLGRIAAQAAKQNIVQKVRDYERSMVYAEFKEHEGSVQSGIVMRFERRNIIVQLRPNVDAILPEKEQIPRERYRQGDRIRAMIVAVNETARGPQIVLSRTSPELVKKLFEQEVPEVYEGIVEIRDVVREPGGRAKISVSSRDSDVDPVGACVGMRGSRVQAVVQELRGERIDIVPWTTDETEFVCRALSPAKVSRIVIDEEARAMEVIVPDSELSLAIGRKGQNVRLAAKLSKWKLDVQGEADYERKQREARGSLQAVEGLGEMRAEMLLADGFKSAAELAATAPDEVAEIFAISKDEAGALVGAATAAAEIQRLVSFVSQVSMGISDAAVAIRTAREERAEAEKKAAEDTAEPEAGTASDEPDRATVEAAGGEASDTEATDA